MMSGKYVATGYKIWSGWDRRWVSHLVRFGDGMCYLAWTKAGVCHLSRKAGDRDRMAGVRIGKKILLNLVEINLDKFKCIQPSLQQFTNNGNEFSLYV